MQNCPSTIPNALRKMSQLTFAPSIHSLDHTIYPNPRPPKSTKEVWEALSKDLRERNQTRINLKAEAEERQIDECHLGQLHCDASRSISGTFDRLYSEADQRKKDQLMREQQKRQQQTQILLQNSRRCQTAKLNSQKIDLSPLYQRLEEVLKAQAQQRRAAEQSQAQPTFTPTLDPHSLLLSAKQHRISNIVDRLLDDHHQRPLRKQALAAQLQAERNKQLTFAPKVNSQFGVEERSQKKERKEEGGEQFTFVPAINTLSQLLTSQRKHQTAEEKIFRLSQAPLISKEQRLQELDEQYSRQCSFNPEINVISQQLGARTPPKHCCPRPQLQTPLHRPTINPASASLTHLQRAKTCELSKKREARRAKQYMEEAQYQRMRECTFRPKRVDEARARSLRKAGSLASVAGYQKFKEQREWARQLERERKQREEQLFRLEKSYDARRKREGKRTAEA